MFQTKVVQKIETRIIRPITFFSPENRAFYETCRKISQSRTGHRLQYGACAVHAGYLRLWAHSQNMI